MVIRPIPHTDLKTSMFYVWLRLDGVCAVADRGPKRSSGVSCLRSDGVSLVRSGHSMPVLLYYFGVIGPGFLNQVPTSLYPEQQGCSYLQV